MRYANHAMKRRPGYNVCNPDGAKSKASATRTSGASASIGLELLRQIRGASRKRERPRRKLWPVIGELPRPYAGLFSPCPNICNIVLFYSSAHWGNIMGRISPRKDRETAADVDAALVMQQELGDDAARAFLDQLGVRRELADRVLTEPPDHRRNIGLSSGRRA